MCKYCGELFTGDSNESLLENRIAMFNTQMIIDADVFITDDELEMYVEFTPTDEQIAKSKIKIKYCPMCGTRLNKEEALTRALL